MNAGLGGTNDVNMNLGFESSDFRVDVKDLDEGSDMNLRGDFHVK